MIKFSIDVEKLKADPRVSQKYKDNPDLLLPKRATEGSVGYDIIMPYTETIIAKNAASMVLESYVKLEMSQDIVAYMHVRSSTGIKRYCRLMNSTGVIDWDYKDTIGVPLRVFSGINERINAGEKIVQIVFHKVLLTDEDLEARKSAKKLDKRDGGFGSTGK